MYNLKELKKCFNETLIKNNLTIDSDYELIKNISVKIEKLSLFKDSSFLDFYSVQDIYLSIEKINFLKKI